MYENIRIIVCDVDGVLTKQDIMYDENGISSYRFFSVKDGSACAAAMELGLRIAWVSGRESKAVEARAKSLNVTDVYLGSINKLAAFEDLQNRYNITYEDMCFVTDDFLDIPVLKRVGLACAVADADEDVRKISHYVTPRKGGEGAFADVVRMILTGRFGDSIFEEMAHAIWSKEKNMPG